MQTRGPPRDVHLRAYWALDEAVDDAVGLDSSGNGRTLTFHGAPLAVPGKLGNARAFEGTSTYAQAVPAAELRVNAATWLLTASLASVNSTGSKLRTLLACDGPGATLDDNTVFALAVDDTGALVFRHDAAAGPVVLRTVPGLFRTGRLHFVGVRRTVILSASTVQLSFNGDVVPWASGTVAGAGLDPNADLPPPVGGLTAVLRLGHAQRTPDSFWHGIIDDVSVHATPRSLEPYIRGEYLRTALAEGFVRITGDGDVRAIAVAQLDLSARLWLYERQGNIFAVRESALGDFGTSVQLTTGGLQGNGAPLAAGASQPRIAYDPASRVAVVAFIAAGRVYKLTLDADDEPNTQNMPISADTAVIIKAREQVDTVRLASGEGTPAAAGAPGTGIVGEALPAAPSISFFHTPTFGIALTGGNPQGYAIFERIGTLDRQVGEVVDLDRSRIGLENTYHFFPLNERRRGARYQARPIRPTGTPGLNGSNVIVDFLGEAGPLNPLEPGLSVNRDGDLQVDELRGTVGESTSSFLDMVRLVDRTPIKLNVDAGVFASAAGGAAEAFTEPVRLINRTPLKLSLSAEGTLSAGGSFALVFTRTSGQGVQL